MVASLLLCSAFPLEIFYYQFVYQLVVLKWFYQPVLLLKNFYVSLDNFIIFSRELPWKKILPAPTLHNLVELIYPVNIIFIFSLAIFAPFSQYLWHCNPLIPYILKVHPQSWFPQYASLFMQPAFTWRVWSFFKNRQHHVFILYTAPHLDNCKECKIWNIPLAWLDMLKKS